MQDFNSLSTTTFALRMRPALRTIYHYLWKDSIIVYQDNTDKDLTMGIDLEITTTTGDIIRIQEKIRQHYYLQRFGNELCVEIANGNSQPAEWDYIKADYYLSCYASANQQNVCCWNLISVPTLKELAELNGGIKNLGKLNRNSTHGKAHFVSIPIKHIPLAISRSFPTNA